MKKNYRDFDDTLRPKTIPHQREDEKLTLSTRQMPRESLIEEVSIERKAYLEVKGGELDSYSLNLDNEEALIGRSPKCKIILKDDGISRMHARIYFVNEEYYIEDLNSTNGSYVNYTKVIKCVLRNHDLIEIGDAKLVFIEEKILQK